MLSGLCLFCPPAWGATQRHTLTLTSPARAARCCAGAIPLLAQLLTSGSRGTRQAAARALSNLVVNSEANKVEVVKFGAIHSLVRGIHEVDGAPWLSA